MKKNIPYPLSRDYKRLRELLDKGYSIVCYADSDNKTIRPICQIRCVSETIFLIGGHNLTDTGYYYHYGNKDDQTFEQHCESRNIEFIDIVETKGE